MSAPSSIRFTSEALVEKHAVRAHLGGDADSLLRPLLNRKEGQS